MNFITMQYETIPDPKQNNHRNKEGKIPFTFNTISMVIQIYYILRVTFLDAFSVSYIHLFSLSLSFSLTHHRLFTHINTWRLPYTQFLRLITISSLLKLVFSSRIRRTRAVLYDNECKKMILIDV